VEKEQIEELRKSLKGSNFGDVMVVGGGYKVYLVDKAPAIGGHMAQLDKTFPTNDCSI
jgi:heterodisulfide reductase subunit A